MKKVIMTTQHPKWDEFCTRLEGPEGCKFTKKSWICDGTKKRPLAKAILQTMKNVDIPNTMKYFSQHGGYCDCEILFNVDRPVKEGR